MTALPLLAFVGGVFVGFSAAHVYLSWMMRRTERLLARSTRILNEARRESDRTQAMILDALRVLRSGRES